MGQSDRIPRQFQVWRNGEEPTNQKTETMKTDTRYSVAREFTGASLTQYVARFCGEWIGAAPTRRGARILATSHRFRTAPGSFRVRPAINYKLLGTGIQLSSRRTYEATPATNQPDWQARELVFVNDVLLEKGEYFAV